MTTIHLSDAQRDTFTASGYIVIDGVPHANYADEPPVAPKDWRILTEPCDTCKGLGFKHWPDYPSGVTVASCAVCGWDIDINRAEHVDREQYLRHHESRGRPFKLDHSAYPAPCPNPDCAGGLRVVTLTATCLTCGGCGETRRPYTAGADVIEPCPNCVTPCPNGLIVADGYDHSWCGRAGVPPCDDGWVRADVVTLGRFTIPALWPVVSLWPRSCEVPCYYNGVSGHPAGLFVAPEHPQEPFTLDPLPQPGQFVCMPERLA